MSLAMYAAPFNNNDYMDKINDTDTPRVSVSFRFLVDPWEWAVNGI